MIRHMDRINSPPEEQCHGFEKKEPFPWSKFSLMMDRGGSIDNKRHSGHESVTETKQKVVYISQLPGRTLPRGAQHSCMRGDGGVGAVLRE